MTYESLLAGLANGTLSDVGRSSASLAITALFAFSLSSLLGPQFVWAQVGASPLGEVSTPSHAKQIGSKPPGTACHGRAADPSLWKRGDRIVARSSSCESLTSVAAQLRQWKTRVDSADSAPGHPLEPKCQVVDRSLVEMPLDAFLPTRARELLLIGQSTKDGPNCFNTALQATGLLPPNLSAENAGIMELIRGEWNGADSETQARFGRTTSPFCTELTAEEPIQPGDIGLVMEPGTVMPTASHAFVAINERLTFSKADLSSQSDYSFKNLEAELACYHVPKSCRKLRGNPNQAPDAENRCRHWVNYFRCKPVDRVLPELIAGAQLSQEFAADLRSFRSLFEEYSCRSQGFFLSAAGFKSLEAITLLTSCLQLSEIARQMSARYQGSKNRLESQIADAYLGVVRGRCGDEEFTVQTAPLLEKSRP